jgi:hypothetical protein
MRAITGQRHLTGLRSVTLLSDGASRLVERFGLTDWTELLAMLADDGPHAIIQRIREVEAADPRGERWPRGKAHDDASIAYCTALNASDR